jgi:hypothetical protein
MFRNFVSKSLLTVRGTTISKQSLFKRQFQIVSSVKSSIKDDLKDSSNPSNEKISGDDIEVIENLMLNKGKYNIYMCCTINNNFTFTIIQLYYYIVICLEKPVTSYIIQSHKKLRSQFKSSKPSYWIEDMICNAGIKQPINQSKPPVHRKLNLRTMSDSYVEVFLPFKSDPELLEEYVNPDGGIR